MATLAELNVVIGARIDDFERNMAAAQRGIGRLGDAAKDAGEAMTKYVTLPISLAAGAALKAAGDIQALEKGFAATYKGSLPLQEALANVRELAKLPGLGLKEALQGATNLQAAGFSADLASRALGAFGNALATVGKGKADLDGVGLALGQIASKGKISAEEINQLAERVPQIREAMKAAFGTADTEALNKAGISATAFVEGVVAELEKLPKVTGGINNAFENFGDGVTIALSKVGASLNKTFDIEGKLNRLGDFITGLANSFESLSPAVQKTVFVVAGLAAAAGPVLFVIGSIGAALPAVTAGFAALGVTSIAALGPIGIAAAAVAAAGLLVYQNWDRVAPVFEELGRILSEVTDSIGGLASAVTRDLGGLGITAADLGSALQAVGRIITDWLVFPFRLLAGGIEATAGQVRAFASLLQGDLSGAADGARQVLDGIKLAFLGINKAVEPQGTGISDYFAGLTTSALGVLGGIQQATGQLDTFARTATNAVARLSDEQQKALDKLRKSLQENVNLSRALGQMYDFVGGRSSALESGIKGLVSAGFDPAGRTVQFYVQQLRNLAEATDNMQSRASKGIALPQVAGPEVALSGGVDFSSLPAALPTLDVTPFTVPLQEATAQMATFQLAGEQFTLGLNEALVNGLSVVAVGVGEAIGQIATNAGGIELVGAALLSGIGSLAIDLGKLAIATGIAVSGIKASLESLNPALAIAGGIALVALGTAVRGAASKIGRGSGGGAPAAVAPRASAGYTSPRTSTAGRQAEKQAPVTVVHEVKFELEGSKLRGAIDIASDRRTRITGSR